MNKFFALIIASSALVSTAYADTIDYGKLTIGYNAYSKSHKGNWMADAYNIKKTPGTYRFVNSYVVTVSEADDSEVSSTEPTIITYRAAPEIIASSGIRKFTHVATSDADKGILWNIGNAHTQSTVNVSKEAKSVNWSDGAGQSTNYIEDDHTRLSYETTVRRDEHDPSKLYAEVSFTVARDHNTASPEKAADSATIEHTYQRGAVIDTREGAFHYGKASGYSTPVTFKIHDDGDVEKHFGAHDYVINIIVNAYSQDFPNNTASTKDEVEDKPTFN